MTAITHTARPDGLVVLHPRAMTPVLEDLDVGIESVRMLGTESAGRRGHLIAGVAESHRSLAEPAAAILSDADALVGDDGLLFVFLLGERSDEELCDVRNRLWPAWHVGAIYRASQEEVTRTTLDEKKDLRRASGTHGTVLVARRRALVFAPETTVAKFDRNARGWNGEPGRPGYAHFRWMRRFVAEFAGHVRARRILDFGCGAGWVGIEAALAAKHEGGDPALCAFDPSPEMVRIAEENARAQNIASFTGRTGFGEAPPFPAEGEERFDLVLSSGVISFAEDPDRWLDGLTRTASPGGTLVIGDIHRDSAGMRKRRAHKPLLPVREMNALVREDVRAKLERRGFAFEAWCGYQLTDPMPQLLHFSQTRLAGMLDGMLLRRNVSASRRDAASGSKQPDRFDSWVMRLRAPK
jgi:SAM-dependent methyltransferase